MSFTVTATEVHVVITCDQCRTALHARTHADIAAFRQTHRCPRVAVLSGEGVAA